MGLLRRIDPQMTGLLRYQLFLSIGILFVGLWKAGITRLSTIQKANEILVLDKGEIVERGAHESLLQNKGYYHKLHNYQTL